MPNFRGSIVVLFTLAVFASQAGAQQEACSGQGTVSTPLRVGGVTEQTGDIVIACVGGVQLAQGTNVPLVDITVYYNTTVTSRLFGSANLSGQTPSEALLLIDEPTTGNGLPVGTGPNQVQYGQTLPLIACLTPLTGCVQTAGPTVSGFATAVSSGSTPAPNLYQGVVSGNSVTFYGIPVLPPGGTGARVYRITNVRVDATAYGGGSGTIPVQAFITVSAPSSLPISNSQPLVGYIQTGLTAGASSAATVSQCASQTKSPATTLTFSENFGTVFKTRLAAQSNTLYAGQFDNSLQNVPGGWYNSESGLVVPIASAKGGLADFGTRLEAKFNNIPMGVRVFVSTSNVNNDGSPVAAPNPVGGMQGNGMANPYVGYAQLVNGEATPDGDTGDTGTFPAVAATDYAAGNVPIAEVAITGGVGTAVWEVVNTNPNIVESLKFTVYVSYTANVPQNLPSLGTGTVNLSYAPTASSFVAGDASIPLPRFAADFNAARPVFTTQRCNSDITVDTLPSGLAVTVDGTSYTTPKAFTWAVGSSHSLGAATPQAGGTGTRYAFASWNVGGANPQTITVPNYTSYTYTANFNTEYLLTTNVNPAAGGTITAGGWYGAGAGASIGASANAGYQFAGFSGNLSGTATPQAVYMNAPKNVVANYAALAPVVTGSISSRSGGASARQWTLTLTNSGPGAANAAQIIGVALTQTSGAACTPVMTNPAPVPSLANPLVVGTVAPSSSGTAGVTVNFTGCAPANRYRVVISFTANSGTYSGSTTLNNQFY